ncbi:hypothetical protein [Rathayibacter festucae]|nr:hypothetical protein [Rathayibacter festucae]
MDVLLLPLFLVAVGPALIVIGLVFYTLGLNHAGRLERELPKTPPDKPDAQLAGADATFSEMLTGFAKVTQAIVLDKSSALWQRITASGLLLIYLGLLYLVISIIPVTAAWITAIVTDKPAAVATETPTPDVTQSSSATPTPQST